MTQHVDGYNEGPVGVFTIHNFDVSMMSDKEFEQMCNEFGPVNSKETLDRAFEQWKQKYLVK